MSDWTVHWASPSGLILGGSGAVGTSWITAVDDDRPAPAEGAGVVGTRDAHEATRTGLIGVGIGLVGVKRVAVKGDAAPVSTRTGRQPRARARAFSYRREWDGERTTHL